MSTPRSIDPAGPVLPKALALLGPTAAGKSALALAVATRWGLPIVSCDSVQVYRGLDIGSAKPDLATRARHPHYLIDCVAPNESFSAGDYVRLALPVCRREPCIISGGTGLYLRSLALTQTRALAQLERDPGAKTAKIDFDRVWMAREGQAPGQAHQALAQIDPQVAREIHPRNLVRVLRALWLCTRLGRPISQVRSQDPPVPRLDLFTVVLDPGQEALAEAIAQRCEAMLAKGWLRELQSLRAQGYDDALPSLATLGYRQLMAHLRGELSLSDAKAAIIKDTAQYARRQRTYFRHQLPPGPTVWISDPGEFPWAKVASFFDQRSLA